MGLFSDKRTYDEREIKAVNTEKAVPYNKDFRESFMDSFYFDMFTGNKYSRADNLHNEFEKEIDKIREATGVELDNPYHSAAGEFFIEDVAKNALHKLIDNPFKPMNEKWDSEDQQKIREQERLLKFYKKAEKLKEQYPNLQIRSATDIQDDIRKQAQELYAKVNDGRDHSTVGDFLGSAAASMADPVNVSATLATGFLSSAAKTTVIKALTQTAVTEFVENSTIEAFIQPDVYDYKKELEVPYSKEEAAANVLAAGVGGSILGTATKAAHLTGRQLLDKFNKRVAAGVKFDGDTKEAAAALKQQVEFDEWSKATNPYGDTLEAKTKHEEQLLTEQQRLSTEKNETDIDIENNGEIFEDDTLDFNLSDQQPVKQKDFENINFEEIEQTIEERADWTPEEKAKEKETLNLLRDEETWDNEILDCILEFSSK